MKRSLRSIISRRPVIFDGAMGTELYSRHHFINVCFEELSETKSDEVRRIHRENREAGADVLTTNSFGANRFKLAEFLLAERTESIARAAARLARLEAGEELLVAGSVGPLGRKAGGEPSEEEALEAFVEPILGLQEGGADFIIFETFSRKSELLLAARAAGAVGMPYIASMAFGERNISRSGDSIQEFFRPLLELSRPPEMLSFNCAVGPKLMLEYLEDYLPTAPLPVLVMPNAGYPQAVQDRMIYMTTPEYFASYARRFVELGARGVGGCCGTGPAHIAEAARSIQALHRAREGSGARTATTRAEADRKSDSPSLRDREGPCARAPEGPCAREPLPVEKRSSLGAKLVRGEWVTSVELTPPLGYDLSGILAKAEECRKNGVDAINIPDGPRASSRVSPLIAAERIRREVGIEVLLHLTCRDRNIIGIQSDLLGCAAAGIHNLLAVTGDPPKLGDYPHATAVFDMDSIGLTRIADRLNRGIDVGGKTLNPATEFLIGVGADPTHLDQNREIARLREKAEAGAFFCVTQPVYDVDALFRFLDKIRDIPLKVVAGVWPLASLQNALFLHNEVPGVRIPDPVMARMERAVTREEARREGVAIAREIVHRIRDRVAGIQVGAPLGNVEIALQVTAS